MHMCDSHVCWVNDLAAAVSSKPTARKSSSHVKSEPSSDPTAMAAPRPSPPPLMVPPPVMPALPFPGPMNPLPQPKAETIFINAPPPPILPRLALPNVIPPPAKLPSGHVDAVPLQIGLPPQKPFQVRHNIPLVGTFEHHHNIPLVGVIHVKSKPKQPAGPPPKRCFGPRPPDTPPPSESVEMPTENRFSQCPWRKRQRRNHPE